MSQTGKRTGWLSNRWIRRGMIGAVCVVIGVLVAVATMWRLAALAPSWYRVPEWSPADIAAASQSAQDKFTETSAWASAARGAQLRARSGTVSTRAPEPAAEFTVSFTQDEINAFWRQWSEARGWDVAASPYIEQPLIAFDNGTVIVAARAVELRTVVSVHLRPTITDEGMLDIRLARLLGGRLALPTALVSEPRQKLVEAIRGDLDARRGEARINPSGAANDQALRASIMRGLLGILTDQPTDAVLYLPLLGGGWVPVKIIDLTVGNGVLTLTARPMDPAERSVLEQRLQARIEQGLAAAK